MARKNYTVEQIIVKLREVELHCNQGKTITEACRELGITEQTYYRWRKEYGGMNTSDARRMKEAVFISDNWKYDDPGDGEKIAASD